LGVLDTIEITKNFELLINYLKNNHRIEIISTRCDCINNHLKNKFNIDFTLANELEFSKSIATDEVKIPSLF